MVWPKNPHDVFHGLRCFLCNKRVLVKAYKQSDVPRWMESPHGPLHGACLTDPRYRTAIGLMASVD